MVDGPRADAESDTGGAIATHCSVSTPEISESDTRVYCAQLTMRDRFCICNPSVSCTGGSEEKSMKMAKEVLIKAK